MRYLTMFDASGIHLTFFEHFLTGDVMSAMKQHLQVISESAVIDVVNAHLILEACLQVHGLNLDRQGQADAKLAARLHKLLFSLRDKLIKALVWNDPNGLYSDEDAAAAGWPPLRIEQLIDQYLDGGEFDQDDVLADGTPHSYRDWHRVARQKQAGHHALNEDNLRSLDLFHNERIDDFTFERRTTS